MVKFGKLYRELQIVEFKENYIDYKKLKQKIKQIKEFLSSISTGIFSGNIINNSLKPGFRLSIKEDEYSSKDLKLKFDENKYREKLLEFKNLLDEEFGRCFKYFQTIERELHHKLNEHLITQTIYSSYVTDDIIKEINKLKKTIYKAKCLNAFINDNMTAIQKILKKFDKKFNFYFGNFGPKYILDSLCKENSDLEQLLEFKIVDETSCIVEDNMKLLREYYLEINQVIKIKKEEDKFFQVYNEILGYLTEIDELIYFKIQYKEWFYFIKKNAVVKKQSELYKNLMFNPILLSPFYKDDIMNKFLTRKEQIKEIEDIQIPLSLQNKINVIMIFVQTFFYNTLISGIYPLQFIYLRDIEDMWGDEYNITEYSFLIISSTYICSYFSIMIYHLFGSKRIKLSYILSNIFFFIGSLFYIISYNYNQNGNFIFSFLITSRIFIGFGANPLMGKKYILSFTTEYFLPKVSKYYVFVSILGHSLGPFFVFLFFSTTKNNMDINEDHTKKELFPDFFYSKYNCIGWYGVFTSFILILIISLFFTSPSSKGFKVLKSKNSKGDNNYENRKNQFLIEDEETNGDKEFYQNQKEMVDKNEEMPENKENTDNENLNEIETSSNTTVKNKEKKENINNKKIMEEDTDEDLKKSMTMDEYNMNMKPLNQLNYKQNPLLFLNVQETDNNNSNNNNFIESEHGVFIDINMIPRTINDLVAKEKKKFSYLNRNLLIILIILFFCNLLKENFIAYSSYYIYNRNKDKDKLSIFSQKFLCLLISLSYFLEMFSMFFILPLYKINTKLKKILVILMSLSIVLMIPICFDIKLYIYFILISIVILISSIIEVLSSAYLAYLTPPDWKFSHINASSLPFYIMNFGKLFGCLICFTSLAEKHFIHNLNTFVILIITTLGYGISGLYIFRSNNFRIKAICRIMRKTELD